MELALILSTVRDMVGKQKYPRPVGVDSLCLMLQMNHSQVMPFIHELVSTRDIIYVPSVSRQSCRGTIQLVA